VVVVGGFWVGVGGGGGWGLVFFSFWVLCFLGFGFFGGVLGGLCFFGPNALVFLFSSGRLRDRGSCSGTAAAFQIFLLNL